jgi:hypothetical protein
MKVLFAHVAAGGIGYKNKVWFDRRMNCIYDSIKY